MKTAAAITAARARMALFADLEKKTTNADYRAGYRADRLRMGRLVQRLVQRGAK